jgi:hypothetical protein
MAKYDWKQLEKEYILSEYKSVKEFLRSKDIKSTGNTNKQTKGWAEKKATKEQQKSNKIVEKVIEKEIEKEVDINTRHLKLYDSFLDVLEGSFKNPAEYMYLEMPDYDKLKKMVDILEKAQKGQRLAKGLDKEENNNENLNKVEELLSKIKEEANK